MIKFQRRPSVEINSSSMADIAFLLLIFFLVTTTMDVDSGIARKLPPMPDEEMQEDDSQINSKNNLENLPNTAAFFSEKDEVVDDNYQLKDKEFISIIPPIGGG